MREIQVEGPSGASPEILAEIAALNFARHIVGCARAHVRCFSSLATKRIYHAVERLGGRDQDNKDVTVILLKVWGSDFWTAGSVFLTYHSPDLEKVEVSATPLTITWRHGTPTLVMEVPDEG